MPLRELLKAGQLDQVDQAIVEINTILRHPAKTIAGVPTPPKLQAGDPRLPPFPPDVILVNGEPFRLTPLEDKPKKRKADK